MQIPPKAVALVMLVVALSTASCARGNAPRRGERPIELLVSSDAETLDPRYATDAVAMRTTRLLHAGLARLDPTTLEPVPYVARSWGWLDEHTLRVELREDVRFHSGAPLRPQDVVATVAAMQSKTVGSRHARVVEPIERITPIGDHAVLIALRRPHATLLTDLELPILREDEASAPPRPDGTLDGLGPFTLASRDDGAITLEPANGAALPRPKHAVTIRTVHDENARALRMHAGRADLVIGGFSPTLLPALEQADALRVTTRAGANVTYLLARVDRGILQDERVRHALSLSIDRMRITSTLLGGRATPATSLLPPTHWAHTGALPLPFDPAKAKVVLGSVPGQTKPLRLSLLTSTERLRGTIARQIAQDARDVGIELDIVQLELGAMLARLAAGDFDLATLQMPELSEPNVLRVFMHSASIPPSGSNRGRIRDPELDALLEQGARERDTQVRRGIYASIERVVRERAWLLPLWHEDHVTISSPRASAFRPSAEGRWLDLAAVP